MNGPRPEAASNLSHFLGVNPICLAVGGFGFAGGVTLLIHRSPPGHVYSVHSTGSHLPNTDTATVGSVYRKKTDSLDRLRHVFSVRCADTHSLNQRPHSAPVYITKWHFYDQNTMAFHVCLLLALPPSDFSHSLNTTGEVD